MGLIGNIVIFTRSGTPSPEPARIAREVIAAFERRGLLRDGAASSVVVSRNSSATFEAYLEESRLSSEEYAYVAIQPEQLTKALGALVYVLDVDEKGAPGPIELPYMEVSVFSRPAPIYDGTLGEVVATSWAAVEFSYEDARINDDVHRVRDERHPIISDLARVFGGAMEWTVVT
jgi:hypothetical protein